MGQAEDSTPPGDAGEAAPADLAFALIALVGAGAIAAGIFVAPLIAPLLEPSTAGLFRDPASVAAPEPTELVRFAIALVAAVIVAIAVAAAPSRRFFGDSGVLRWARVGVPAAVIGLLVVGWVARSEPLSAGLFPQYFGNLDLAIALVIAGGIVCAIWRGWWTPQAHAKHPLGSRERLGTRVLSAVVALAATALFVSPAIYVDRNLADAPGVMLLHLPFAFGDFAAFGNGATPLGDFASQYSSLLPYALHLPLAALDYSPGGYTVLMALLSSAALLAVWRALALAADDERIGLALYVPVLAISLRPMLEAGDERFINASLLQTMPERYLLPCLLLWLCARHLRGRWPHSQLPLFLVAGLALLNNPEFGAPAYAAAFAATVAGRISGARLTARVVIDSARSALLGMALAAVLVATVTLIRGGSLPDPDLFAYFLRTHSSHGLWLQPMPAVGFQLIVYATFAGALILAAVRFRTAATDPVVGGLLAFIGVFGLLAGGYYAGRSNAVSMVALFPAWGFALALLAWCAVRWLTSAIRTGLSIATPVGALALSCLLGFGLAASDLLDAPAPWTQVQRLTDASERQLPLELSAEERFLSARTEPGEPVLILREYGHLLARRARVRNVSLIGDPVYLVSDDQLTALLADLRAAGGNRVFLGDGHYFPLWSSISKSLEARGFSADRADEASGLTEYRRG